MILQQTQNAFSDKMAQFTLIPLGSAVGFVLLIPVGAGVEVDVPSAAGLMMALPMILFAPLTGWLSDRFSKRDVMLGASMVQSLVLALIVVAVWWKNMPLALGGFFALAVQAAFYSPAKIGITKELVGSKHLGFAAGIQQMTAMLAILVGQIFAGWLFDHRFTGHGGGSDIAWTAALFPLLLLAGCSLPSLALAWSVPRVPAQGGPPFTVKMTTRHFASLLTLWQDAALRRASFGVAFFWGFAAFINLWSVKLAKTLTGGGEGFGTMSSLFMAAASLGMAAGFGFASFLMRKRIELGWVPVAGFAMTLSALALAFMNPGGIGFLSTLAFLAFSGAVFLAPLSAWMQDRYPAEKRGELQSAVNLQDCIAGIIAVFCIGVFEYSDQMLHVPPIHGFRLEIGFVGLVCGLMSLSSVRLLPGDFIRLLGGALVRTIYRIKVVNRENIPAAGGALLLPNHVTFADGFFIAASCSRPVRFVMDEVFMAKPSIRLFARIFEIVAIRQDQPREAIRITIDALKQGGLVCLFPEGQLTRTGTLNELRRGFELIARKAGHPLIPMWCDGSWTSIFSFERGRFFRKVPYHLPFGMTLAFGKEIPAGAASLDAVREGLHRCSADALAAAFDSASWEHKRLKGKSPLAAQFRATAASTRRRLWMNGHQLAQINALQRHTPFQVLAAESLPLGLLAFADLFDSPLIAHPTFQDSPLATWVGGELVREMVTGECVFYDFSPQALEPISRPGVQHFPCLAVAGMVISMSMPHPALPQADSEYQPGHKPGTWGKLLPGWYLVTGENGQLHAHGPAAPAEGLALPPLCFLDPEGFLTAPIA
jgi:acyl-[acyl-carrier-protein]-phospholipid O-acyltransferase / long-chain-fatty-acid--[acyl-carrier-protein] ligase